jgi:hypothetical protein
LPEHEGRANLVDCTLISRFSARRRLVSDCSKSGKNEIK